LSGVAMFHMGADVVILAVAAASASIAVAIALVVTASISSPLGRLQRSVRRLAGGDFAARVPEEGPAEIVEVAAALNHMAARLEDAFDARRELVAWASHDLRTPLTALQSTVEAVEDGVVEPGHYLPAIRENIQALRRLVDDLFDLARLDAGTAAFDIRSAQIGPLVDGCLTAVLPTAAVPRIRVEQRVAGGLPDVLDSTGGIERVLMNL